MSNAGLSEKKEKTRFSQRIEPVMKELIFSERQVKFYVNHSKGRRTNRKEKAGDV